MKLTFRSEYALLALVYIARRETEGGHSSAPAIAEAQSIPLKYLEQILLILKRGGLLHSRKGRGGGFRLARSPAEISLAEVIRLIDGALAPTDSVSRFFYGPTPLEGEARLLSVMQEIRDHIAAKLEGTTLADVL